jgi:YesN/AraC family two-component response regulator
VALADTYSPLPRTRVLIADDSEAVRTSLSSLIARLPGVEIVGMAHTGAQALEMVRSLMPDVVTLDIRMPEMNGMRVLEAIRSDPVKPTVIVLTGLEDVEYRQRCLQLGAEHFFNKATEFEKVIEILAARGGAQSDPPPSA